MIPIPADRIPVRLPHYRLRNGALYFLVSRRPIAALDALEREVWESLDGTLAAGEVAARFPGGTGEAALGRFVELGACLPVEALFPGGRRRILVIEPHMDDGVLSLGGTMWTRRRSCEFTILSLAGRCNFTSYYYLDRDHFDVEAVSALRRAESALLARAIGGRHVDLDLPEAPLRYRDGNWSLEWFRRHRGSVSAFITHASGPAELRAWADALARALRDLPADEIWAPLGVAPHTDHELTRNAFLTVLAGDPGLLERSIVRLYQEVPYAARYPEATHAVVEGLNRAGLGLELERLPMGDALPEKLRLISLFGSQFKLASMRPDVEASARLGAGEEGPAELLYRVQAPPRDLDPVALSVHAREVRRVADEVGPWLARNRRARRVRILLRSPAGRWREDVQRLLEALPEARLEVRASAEAVAEPAERRSERITVAPVGRGAAAWLFEIARANLGGPAPTLVVAFPDRMREARLLARLLPWSDAVAVPDMDHLDRAMRLLAARATRGADSGL